jgi:MOSC domain-containing protein YiiM
MSVELIADKGIVGNGRYFGRTSRSTGLPTKRQITLIEREQIVESLPPGIVRSNIETDGINLVELIGRQIEIGEARLFLCEPRKPCAKMDGIYPGLRALMEGSRQGVLAQVVRSGLIRQGDTITLANE